MREDRKTGGNVDQLGAIARGLKTQKKRLEGSRLTKQFDVRQVIERRSR
jgi:hypothetical protein